MIGEQHPRLNKTLHVRLSISCIMHSVGGPREQHRVRYHQCRSARRREPCFNRNSHSCTNMLVVCSSMYTVVQKGIKVCSFLSILLVHQQHQHPTQHSIQRLPYLHSFQHLSATYTTFRSPQPRCTLQSSSPLLPLPSAASPSLILARHRRATAPPLRRRRRQRRLRPRPPNRPAVSAPSGPTLSARPLSRWSTPAW